jgi:carbamoyl-phosphate synthase small subunit
MIKEPCILALEDGRVFYGKRLGEKGETRGEVVFNTSMTGYQEILTDPSYAGQIVTMTYPLIGNYGVNREDFESRGPFVEGFVVRESSGIYSNWRATGSLHDFLLEFGIVGISDIDTRALTKHIRSEGAMRGVISSIDLDEKSLIVKAREIASLVGRDLVKEVTASEPYLFAGDGEGRYRVAVFDCGVKLNILRSLQALGCSLDVVPANYPAEAVLEFNPDGVVFSNGPGDPQAVSYTIATMQELLGKKPIFGICLGHQMLGLALGGKTYKLKFGHHGSNHPVKNLKNGKIEITAQNHGFAVEEESVRDQAEITHVNLNDGTVEGMRCQKHQAFSVQYHPEASPGPHDARYLFEEFARMMERGRKKPGRVSSRTIKASSPEQGESGA